MSIHMTFPSRHALSRSGKLEIAQVISKRKMEAMIGFYF